MGVCQVPLTGALLCCAAQNAPPFQAWVKNELHWARAAMEVAMAKMCFAMLWTWATKMLPASCRSCAAFKETLL